MLLALHLLLALLRPSPMFVEDRYDVLVRNDVHDARGKLVFQQLGGMDMEGVSGEYRWQWWRLLEDTGCPRRDYRGGGWTVTWRDRRTRTWRRVTAPSYIVLMTRCDAEIRDREYLPENLRRGLAER